MRKNDIFWEHAEKLEGTRFRYKFYDRNFSGDITRVKTHLTGVQGRDIEVCSKVSEEVQAQAFITIDVGNKKSKTTSISGNETGSQKNSNSLLKGMHQTTVPQLSKQKMKQNVDKLLARHIILNNISCNVLQTDFFNDYVRAVAEYGPSYKLPSYSTLRTKLIPNARTDVSEYVSEVKKSWLKTGYSLMSDIWSDMKQEAYINIIDYSLRGVVFMNAFEVSCERKTGLYLKNIISFVIEEIGSKHVVQFVTDNATNFGSAGDML